MDVTEEEKIFMSKLGFTYDSELDMFFLEDNLFIRNVPNYINNVDQIIAGEVKDIPVDICEQLYDMTTLGYQFSIGMGGVDSDGVQHSKGLYLTNNHEMKKLSERKEEKLNQKTC